MFSESESCFLVGSLPKDWSKKVLNPDRFQNLGPLEWVRGKSRSELITVDAEELFTQSQVLSNLRAVVQLKGIVSNDMLDTQEQALILIAKSLGISDFILRGIKYIPKPFIPTSPAA